MEEYKAKSHAVKKMTRNGLVEMDSAGKESPESVTKDHDGRRINEADFELERKEIQPRDASAEEEVMDSRSRQKTALREEEIIE